MVRIPLIMLLAVGPLASVCQAAEALTDRRYADRVSSSTQEAHAHGINSIPAFVLDNRLLVLGAQPHELFEQAFAKLTELADTDNEEAQ